MMKNKFKSNTFIISINNAYLKINRIAHIHDHKQNQFVSKKKNDRKIDSFTEHAI